MAPHVPGLLGWLADLNWPHSGGFWGHLERFPELAVDPIREILREGGDGEWEYHLLEFLTSSVP
ncbi:hypothetical protein B0H19DRAFT_841177, partial [Mycena capillaripes]